MPCWPQHQSNTTIHFNKPTCLWPTPTHLKQMYSVGAHAASKSLQYPCTWLLNEVNMCESSPYLWYSATLLITDTCLHLHICCVWLKVKTEYDETCIPQDQRGSHLHEQKHTSILESDYRAATMYDYSKIVLQWRKVFFLCHHTGDVLWFHLGLEHADARLKLSHTMFLIGAR